MKGSGHRYAGVASRTVTLADGREVAYLPARGRQLGASAGAGLRVVTTEGGDRLDRVAHATLGDPEQAWQLCDANAVLDPLTLDDEAGFELVVPTPGGLG